MFKTANREPREGVGQLMKTSTLATSVAAAPAPHRGHSNRTVTVPRPVVVPADFTVDDSGFYKRYGKRTLDLVLTSIALILLVPVFPLIALAVVLSSPGPVLYRSTRLGKGGKPFTFLKFRSMVADAHQHQQNLRHLNEVDGPVFKLSNDPRVTAVGGFLRRTSLDELPQLFNVLKGDMTLVGPRPPIPEEVEKYEPWQRRRLDVTPGITCLWQISGRSRLGFNEWMRLDLQYIQHRSFRLDFMILLRTIPAVLSRDGAY
jgi:lipopolysaccharide/colanic/teichoic acid biosynthesis glycosyltransferase